MSSPLPPFPRREPLLPSSPSFPLPNVSPFRVSSRAPSITDRGEESDELLASMITIGPSNEPIAGERRRQDYSYRLALGIHVTLVVCFSIALCVMLVSFADTYSTEACDKQLKLWCVVWVVLLTLQSFNVLIITFMRLSRRTRLLSMGPYYVQRFLRLTVGIWFVLGIKPIFFDKTCDEATFRWARTLWWLQAVFFLLPLSLFLLLCFCIPCILLVVVRMSNRTGNQRPTPASIIDQLDTKTYRDVIESLKLAFGASEVRKSQPVHVLADVLQRHPVAELLDVASGILPNGVGDEPVPSSSAPTAPAENGRAEVLTLEVNESCPICMGDFDETDVVMIMPCDGRHYFHPECVKPWLQNSQMCPICRSNVVHILDPSSNTAQRGESSTRINTGGADGGQREGNRGGAPGGVQAIISNFRINV